MYIIILCISSSMYYLYIYIYITTTTLYTYVWHDKTSDNLSGDLWIGAICTKLFSQIASEEQVLAVPKGTKGYQRVPKGTNVVH